MSTIVRALVPLCAIALIASAAAAQSKPQSKPKGSSTLITQEEIENARPNVGNAFDVVQLLRPRWLGRAREVLTLPGSAYVRMSEVHIYVDDRDRGDVEFLKTIPAELIFSLKFMSTTEVGARFGPSSGPGIVVTLMH